MPPRGPAGVREAWGEEGATVLSALPPPNSYDTSVYCKTKCTGEKIAFTKQGWCLSHRAELSTWTLL